MKKVRKICNCKQHDFLRLKEILNDLAVKKEGKVEIMYRDKGGAASKTAEYPVEITNASATTEATTISSSNPVIEILMFTLKKSIEFAIKTNVSFGVSDITYKTNRYGMLFLLLWFTSPNNHLYLAGGALLTRNTKETAKYVCTGLKRMMHDYGMQPLKVMMVDHDFSYIEEWILVFFNSFIFI